MLWTRCSSCISQVGVYIGHVRGGRKNKNPNPLSTRHSLILLDGPVDGDSSEGDDGPVDGDSTEGDDGPVDDDGSGDDEGSGDDDSEYVVDSEDEAD